NWRYRDSLRGDTLRSNTGGQLAGVGAGAAGDAGGGSLAVRLLASSLDAGSPGLSEFPTPEARRREAHASGSARWNRGEMELAGGARLESSVYDDPKPLLGTTPIHAAWRGQSGEASVSVRHLFGAPLLVAGADLRGE